MDFPSGLDTAAGLDAILLAQLICQLGWSKTVNSFSHPKKKLQPRPLTKARPRFYIFLGSPANSVAFNNTRVETTSPNSNSTRRAPLQVEFQPELLRSAQRAAQPEIRRGMGVRPTLRDQRYLASLPDQPAQGSVLFRRSASSPTRPAPVPPLHPVQPAPTPHRRPRVPLVPRARATASAAGAAQRPWRTHLPRASPAPRPAAPASYRTRAGPQQMAATPSATSRWGAAPVPPVGRAAHLRPRRAKARE